MNANIAKILVADDEENTRLAIMRALQLSGFHTEGASNGVEVFEKINQGHFDLLLLDLRMPEMNGVEVLGRLLANNVEIAVIVLTAHASLDSAIASIKAGAIDYLVKPQKMIDIEKAIRLALNKKNANAERRQLIEAAKATLKILDDEPDNPGRHKKILNESAFHFDPLQRMVTIRDGEVSSQKSVSLTADQTAILEYFFNHQERVISSCEIARLALKYPEISNQDAEKLIRSHILRLRQKIEKDPHRPEYLRTLRDAGYLFSTAVLK